MTGAVVPAVLAAAAVAIALASSGRRGGRRPPDPSAPSARAASSALDRALLLVAVVPALALVAGAAPASVLVVGAVLVRYERRRRARRRVQHQRDGAFPDLVDRFRIAAAAGHPVHRCLEVVADRAPDPVRHPLADAVARARRGVPLARALEDLGPELGSSGPVLTDALRAALRTGAPLGPVLDRVGDVARDRRARSAQAAARRLPVSMLFPLVCCVLPAFGLLAVVPLLAGSLGSLAP